MKLKLNGTQEIAALLIIFAIGAIIKNNFQMQIFIHLAATVGFGVIIFYVFKYLTKQNKNIWNTIISCLIIFLVLHYGSKPTDALATMLVVAFVVFSKYFMEWKGSPIFNPVVLGFLALELLSNFVPSLKLSFVSWWGASYSFGPVPVTLILIAIWIIFSFKVWRKWYAALSYLIFLAIGLFVSMKIAGDSTALDFLKFTFTNSTIYFFTFVMLAEPRTSPLMRNQQIIYGFIAAVFSTISALTHFPTSDLLAILVPNLYFFVIKWNMLRKMQAAKLPQNNNDNKIS
ncbi:MAG: hypothetical protein NTZ25_02640 [Candidatus Peregrinibacteria bacterium]|nr:hypothetical protein [Candidatus Peregrinibacteria bacterium]